MTQKCGWCGGDIDTPHELDGRTVCSRCATAAGVAKDEAPAVSAQLCDNCGRGIGKLESAHVWKDHAVCSECYSLLKTQEVNYATPVATALMPPPPPPPMMMLQRQQKFPWGIVGTICITLGLLTFCIIPFLAIPLLVFGVIAIIIALVT